jgi:anti-sigma factor RsiW
MRCSTVRERLPALTEEALPKRVSRHVARCDDCRVEVARYEQLSDALAALPARPIEPPADLRPALIAIAGVPRRVMRSHLARNRRAYLKGVVVAAAGMAGAVAVKTRGRHPATA